MKMKKNFFPPTSLLASRILLWHILIFLTTFREQKGEKTTTTILCVKHLPFEVAIKKAITESTLEEVIHFHIYFLREKHQSPFRKNDF